MRRILRYLQDFRTYPLAPLRLTRRCWCEWHWGGSMTSTDVTNHNRVAREIAERMNNL